MGGEYGRWHRPAFGKLHTRPAPHSLAAIFALPREGTGDYRHPVARAPGAHSGASGSRFNAGSLWHNSAPTVVEQDRRDENREAEYIPRRNGVAEFKPYVWREDGWQERAEYHGLDLAELALIDAAIDARRKL